MDTLLEVRDLVVHFHTYQGVVQALEGVNLTIKAGEAFGLVGETGCGKTLTALSLMALIPFPGRVEGGSVVFRTEAGGELDLLQQREGFLRQIRGREIAMVFQEPGAALDPVYPVAMQISEALFLHQRRELCLGAREAALKAAQDGGGWRPPGTRPWLLLAASLYGRMAARPASLGARFLARLPGLARGLKEEARRRVIALLRDMEIGDPERIARQYPHELSGGMKQRVMIAMALGCNPRLLIADEPTTSLDVTVQAQILELLRRLKRERGASLLYITHALAVVAELCDRVGVMYAGTVAEVAPVGELFRNPLHPYTKALLAAIPKPGSGFKPIPGSVPDLTAPPSGCRFHPRCPYVMPICPTRQPPLAEVAPGHRVACYLYY